MPHLEVNDSIVTRNLTVEELLSVDQGPLQLDEVAAPGTPATGKVRLYAKSDGRLYLKDDAGVEVQLDPAGLAVLKSLFDAMTVLVANVNDTPVALALAAGELLGRLRSGGNIIGVTAANVLDILSSVMPYALAPNLWYDGSVSGGTEVTTTVTLTANRLYGIPFWSPKKTTWAKIGINCTTLFVGAEFKLAIYDSDQYGQPNARLFSGAAQDLSTTGSKEETINLEIPAGKLFIGGIGSSGAVAVTASDRYSMHMIGAADTANEGGLYYYSDAGTYAAGPPATFGTPTSALLSALPRFMLKASATP